MKRVMIALCVICAVAVVSYAQQQGGSASAQSNSLTSDNLDLEGKNLDSIIKDINDKIQKVIQKHKLNENKDVKIIPYQTDYEVFSDHIFIERHVFIRNTFGRISGERRKGVKFYVSGAALSKIESTVYERDYDTAEERVIEITDPSPMTDATDDIIVKQYFAKKLTLSRTLGEMKNTTAFPVRNDFKRDFYIPHITYFYDRIQSIAETYAKNAKDDEAGVTDFLIRSADY